MALLEKGVGWRLALSTAAGVLAVAAASRLVPPGGRAFSAWLFLERVRRRGRGVAAAGALGAAAVAGAAARDRGGAAAERAAAARARVQGGGGARERGGRAVAGGRAARRRGAARRRDGARRVRLDEKASGLRSALSEHRRVNLGREARLAQGVAHRTSLEPRERLRGDAGGALPGRQGAAAAGGGRAVAARRLRGACGRGAPAAAARPPGGADGAARGRRGGARGLAGRDARLRELRAAQAGPERLVGAGEGEGEGEGDGDGDRAAMLRRRGARLKEGSGRKTGGACRRVPTGGRAARDKGEERKKQVLIHLDPKTLRLPVARLRLTLRGCRRCPSPPPRTEAGADAPARDSEAAAEEEGRRKNQPRSHALTRSELLSMDGLPAARCCREPKVRRRPGARTKGGAEDAGAGGAPTNSRDPKRTLSMNGPPSARDNRLPAAVAAARYKGGTEDFFPMSSSKIRRTRGSIGRVATHRVTFLMSSYSPVSSTYSGSYSRVSSCHSGICRNE